MRSIWGRWGMRRPSRAAAVPRTRGDAFHAIGSDRQGYPARTRHRQRAVVTGNASPYREHLFLIYDRSWQEPVVRCGCELEEPVHEGSAPDGAQDRQLGRSRPGLPTPSTPTPTRPSSSTMGRALTRRTPAL
jgi:hypothetical protein